MKAVATMAVGSLVFVLSIRRTREAPHAICAMCPPFTPRESPNAWADQVQRRVKSTKNRDSESPVWGTSRGLVSMESRGMSRTKFRRSLCGSRPSRAHDSRSEAEHMHSPMAGDCQSEKTRTLSAARCRGCGPAVRRIGLAVREIRRSGAERQRSMTKRRSTIPARDPANRWHSRCAAWELRPAVAPNASQGCHRADTGQRRGRDPGRPARCSRKHVPTRTVLGPCAIGERRGRGASERGAMPVKPPGQH
jgi:hypothetical protein